MTHTDTRPTLQGPATTERDWAAIDERVHLLDTVHQTRVVQHTIALNTTLQRTAVPEAVREFLLEVWVEAVATAEAQFGVDSEVARSLHQTGSELIRIGCKRRRHDRKLVYGARLPALCRYLQAGMKLLGLGLPEQERQLQALNLGMGERMGTRPGTAPTDAWSAAVLLLSRREPYVDGFHLHSHRELDDQALRMLSHHDHLRLQVVCHGGQEPDADTLARVRGLRQGARFLRKRNPVGRYPVQLAWLGADGQLCLLFDELQTGYLYHRTRLARHLQSGILSDVA